MSKPSTRSLAVLVADDTRELLALISGWLEEAGHAVVGASTGSQVVQQMEQQPFDLLVTDILMPDGDGWAAIADVHRLHPGTRILAISGGTRGMPANAVLRVAQRAGAIGFLAKPFSRLEFLSAISSVMATRRAKRTGAIR